MRFDWKLFEHSPLWDNSVGRTIDRVSHSEPVRSLDNGKEPGILVIGNTAVAEFARQIVLGVCNPTGSQPERDGGADPSEE